MAAIDRLAALLEGRKVTVLTGAGCSTESGIPDYGGLHSSRRARSIRYGAFVRDPATRARYWSRSAVGWPRMERARPNPAHRALATLERAGLVRGVITQNVDGLHQSAGARRVVELHGSLARVRCLDCGDLRPRIEVQRRLRAWNPHLEGGDAPTAPDGDAEVTDRAANHFRVPGCALCGGILKPDVVFFGENVPRPVTDAAWSLYEDAETLLVVGSSLAVFSGYRFAQRAAREGRPLAIVNEGVTRADSKAQVRVAGRAGTVLTALVSRLVGNLPTREEGELPTAGFGPSRRYF